jgi:mercuric ion binding protein
MRPRTLIVGPIVALVLASLSGCSPPPAQQADTAATAQGGDRTQMFAVEGMTCATCPIAVKQAMASVDGVRSVTVDFEARRATVVFDAARATPDAIARAATNAGFPTTAIE